MGVYRYSRVQSVQCMGCVQVEDGAVIAMCGLCTGRRGYSQCNVWVVYR